MGFRTGHIEQNGSDSHNDRKASTQGHKWRHLGNRHFLVHSCRSSHWRHLLPWIATICNLLSINIIKSPAMANRHSGNSRRSARLHHRLSTRCNTSIFICGPENWTRYLSSCERRSPHHWIPPAQQPRSELHLLGTHCPPHGSSGILHVLTEKETRKDACDCMGICTLQNRLLL